ncbi:hypothetical protein BB559_001930 [Furculomyces boomerangus]|uniref:Oxidase FUB9 n=1 Tax=Furculomyces boomerangus TaxID=61424 RepID=A0A2T9YZK6_9FUNG|nr:hypothetical protein BB559_001930 [Furculomyces boomerangus]
MAKIASLKDIEEAAIKKLDTNALNYYYSGAQDMITLHDNSEAFDRYQIRPRTLRDVSNVDMGVTVFGKKFSSPIFIAATAMQKMANPVGELGNVRSACKHNVGFSLSSISTSSIEEVADAVKDLEAEGHKSVRYFQLYVYKERAKTLNLIRRAEKAGYDALFVTVDTPYLGRRLPDIRDNFKMPYHLKLANFQTSTDEVSDSTTESENSSWLARYFTDQVDPSLTWNDVLWVKQQTKLPIVIKGILTAEDAKLVVQHNFDGIIVSNHGGRQLDSVSATIDALAEVVEAVEGKIPVFLDGGVRRGTDVFKALALGAKAVFVGRPALWALSYDGEAGVDLMLDIIIEEFRMAMALSGCTETKDITKDYVKIAPKYISKL